jgi:hypothetical protein
MKCIIISALLFAACCCGIVNADDFTSLWQKGDEGSCDVCQFGEPRDEHPPLKVTNGDTVTLTYVNTHNVYQFDDVNAFRNCDFNLAVKICETGTDSTCDNIPTDTNGIYYFGCSIGDGHHCKNHGMKFAMVVSKKHRAPPNLRA